VPLQIGITGNIGSGKSLVCRIFSCLGIPVYDADSHAKELMTTDGILVSNIKKEFGELSYNTDGSLNRKYLSLTVFNDPARLRILNKLVHPRVRDDYSRWVVRQDGTPYVLKEAALLFEAGSAAELHKVIVVDAPQQLRIRRVLKRDTHRDKDQVMTIEKNQMTAEEKIRRADFIVINDEKVLVIPQVLDLHARFLSITR
jgi:dephospho-CoA kinase